MIIQDLMNGIKTENDKSKLSALRQLWSYVRKGNCTRESLDVFATRQNKRLERTIGGALRMIEQDRIEEGLDCFYAVTGEFSEGEFDYRVSELLPKTSQKDSFLVSDCTEEVGILRSLMKSEVKKRLSGADLDKLSYLVFLLNTKEEAFRQQRAELIGTLRKKDSQDR